MTWTYSQGSGFLDDPDGTFCGQCYSGHGDGLNNHAMEAVVGVGPIPWGTYKIGPARVPIDHLGPVAMPLTVVAFDDPTITRSGFFMHGDNSAMNHTGSDGCIVAGRAIRDVVDESDDDDLLVTP